jgi:hypothetical protein
MGERLARCAVTGAGIRSGANIDAAEHIGNLLCSCRCDIERFPDELRTQRIVLFENAGLFAADFCADCLQPANQLRCRLQK